MTGPMLVLAGLSGAAIVGGLVLAVWALVPVEAPPPRPGGRRGRRWRQLMSDDGSRARTLPVAAAAAGVAVWAVSGWPVGGAVVALAVVGVPWLLGQLRSGSRQITRLEALQEWVRRASDMIAAGGGLEQTLIRSARTAPPPIAAEVQTLAARLRARWPTSRALLAFADDIDDAAGDLVAGALLLGAELRGPGLARVLTELAGSLTDEVTMRRKVEADRAKPRANARWVVLSIVAGVGLLALAGDYIAPYGTLVGQLVLTVAVAWISGCLLWMRGLSIAPPTPRFLVDDRTRPGGPPAPAPAAGVAR